jgi:hypothetical protein
MNPYITRRIDAETPYYRITSRSLLTSDSRYHKRVVNGQGAVKSAKGARYNYPGVVTVYLTDDKETAFAEKMFYFHREILKQIDGAHISGIPLPPFSKHYVLWQIEFRQDIDNVVNLCGHSSAVNVLPSMMHNPSNDYYHLKQKRAELESIGYQGLIAPSSRSKHGGKMIVLFEDQSNNIYTIGKNIIEFRLVDQHGGPLANISSQLVDFEAGEVNVYAAGKPTRWQRIEFNH